MNARSLIASTAVAVVAVACASANHAAVTHDLTARVTTVVGLGTCLSLDGVRVVVRDERGRIVGAGQTSIDPTYTPPTSYTPATSYDPLAGHAFPPDVPVPYRFTLRVDDARFYAIAIGSLRPYVVSAAELHADHWQLNYNQAC